MDSTVIMIFTLIIHLICGVFVVSESQDMFFPPVSNISLSSWF